MMRLIVTMLMVFMSCIEVREAKEMSDDCYVGNSTSYEGTRDYTASGKICQKWTVDEPHMYRHIPKNGDHNYCRNPDTNPIGTWCYTTDKDTRWEYCNISKCPENFIIWTSINTTTKISQLLRLEADLKKVMKNIDSGGWLNITVLSGSTRNGSEHWALAEDYKNQRLYFADIRLNYFGVINTETNVVEKYFEGMAHGIESIAIDPTTNNIYWTDSTFKWVMVAEKTFTYYTPVYRTAPDRAYGLAVHSKKRLLIFSTYKPLGAKIFITDLAGQNATVLFQFPEIYDATGITIDHDEDKIYWTDFTGYGSKIMSSLLDGTKRTEHFYKSGAIFWDIALYMDYIYTSDVRLHLDGAYYLHVFDKNTMVAHYFKLVGKPRGLVTYSSQTHDLSSDIVKSPGECTQQKKCEQLCLPRMIAPKVCSCTLGTFLANDSRTCRRRIIEDDYLLIVDSGQRKVFQMPLLSIDNEIYYSNMPIDPSSKPSAVANDPNSNTFYWSDKESRSLFALSLDESVQSLISSIYATSIIVDPQTKNLFYSDGKKGTIILSNKFGNLTKVIVKPETGKNIAADIRMIVQDIKYKYIYWTDTFSKEGEGQVLRCRYDGSEKEVVLDNLHWPHAISIDYKKNRLYVVEAKRAQIYEADLSTLIEIDSTYLRQNIYSKRELLEFRKREEYLIDLKIHQDMAYLIGGKSHSLYRFNVTEGVSSIKPYGPSEFYRLISLSVFSKNYFEQYMDSQSNPCKNTYCDGICAAISETISKCLCG